MTKRTCSIDGCDQPVVGRGWCKLHWQRWSRTGDPLKVRNIIGDLPARMRLHAPPGSPDECWPFIPVGGRDKDGYGRLKVGARYVRTHRIAWELTHGPIPDGLLVCHRCDNPPCCNPAHLFLGTHADNIRDKIAKGRAWNGHRSKTHCPRGHPYDEANTYVTAKGGRICRLCRRLHQARYVAARAR